MWQAENLEFSEFEWRRICVGYLGGEQLLCSAGRVRTDFLFYFGCDADSHRIARCQTVFCKQDTEQWITRGCHVVEQSLLHHFHEMRNAPTRVAGDGFEAFPLVVH